MERQPSLLCPGRAAPAGLGLDTYNSNDAVGLRCNTGSDGLHRMANLCDVSALRWSEAAYRGIFKPNWPQVHVSIAQAAIECIADSYSAIALLNHLANSAQAVPALARSAGAALNDRQSATPLDAAPAAHSTCRAVGRETPWGADGLPRRSEGLRSSHEPSWVGGGTHVKTCAKHTDQ